MHNQYHLIKNSDKNIAFHFPTNTIINITQPVYHIINSLQNGIAMSEISEDLGINASEIDEFLASFYKSVPKQKANNNITNRKKRTGRITLHISNICNLKCKYCYADGGSYKLDEGLMSKETAIDFVDFLTSRFDIIETIVFFGGEPLMNPDIIEVVCDRFMQAAEQKKIHKIPDYGVITNGTILNNKILQILKKHINFITVSIDGEKRINDANRVFANGEGSYDKISNFIQTIRSETNIKLKYEATYTDKHKEMNISESDISAYLTKEFNLGGTIATDINIQKDSSTNVKNKSIDIENGYISNGIVDMLAAMIHNNYREMCPVGSNITSVSINGDIYPCHMNTGKEHLSFGSIYGNNIFDNRSEYENIFPFLKNLNKTNEPCKDCWIQKLCGGCAIVWFFDNKSDKYNALPNDNLCIKNREHIEKVIAQIAEIKESRSDWEKLLNIVDNKRVKPC
jgi:uncharacterized protein